MSAITNWRKNVKNIVALIILVFSFNLLSSDELPKAPKEFIAELVESCKHYAQDEEVNADEVKQFILDCVNEDMEANGYAKLALSDLKLDSES